MKPKQNSQTTTLIVGGILFFLISYISFFLLPTLDKIKKASIRLEANRKARGELKKLLEERPIEKKTDTKPFEGSLSTFVESKAKELNIKIAKMQPYGKTQEGVEVTVEEMAGKELVNFAYQMENSGIKIVRLNARDYKGQGIWWVKMNLQKG